MSVEPLAAVSGTPSQYRMEDMRPSLVANAETVRHLLPEFDQVSITLVGSTGGAFTCAQAGEVTNDLDRLQYGLGEGPCIDSIQGGGQVVAPHIERDDRWHRYVSSAAEFGLRAQLAAPLRVRGGAPMGALNLYSTTQADIASTAPLIAEALAAQVAGVLDSSREIENLHRALATRKTIGMAVGLLMAEYQLSEAAAFAVLKRFSSSTNVRIRDIAARMVADGNAAVVMPTAHDLTREHHVPDTEARVGSRSLRRKSATSEATRAVRADDDKWFQVIYVDPSGRTYEMTLQAPSDVEAVRRADGALDDVERIGIHDSLHGDGLTVRPPARLHVARVQAHRVASGLGLVITDPNGTVTRRQLAPRHPSRPTRPFAALGTAGGT